MLEKAPTARDTSVYGQVDARSIGSSLHQPRPVCRFTSSGLFADGSAQGLPRAMLQHDRGAPGLPAPSLRSAVGQVARPGRHHSGKAESADEKMDRPERARREVSGCLAGMQLGLGLRHDEGTSAPEAHVSRALVKRADRAEPPAPASLVVYSLWTDAATQVVGETTLTQARAPHTRTAPTLG